MHRGTKDSGRGENTLSVCLTDCLSVFLTD